MKNILILSNSNPYKAAGIVSLDIYNGLKKHIQNVKIVVYAFEQYKNPDIISIQSYFDNLKFSLKKKYHNFVHRLGITNSKETNRDYSVRDFLQTTESFSTDRILKKAGFKPDVVIVLFMQRMVTFKNLYEIQQKTGAKILLYPMDMAPFTGGCHFAWDCSGYTNMCGNCPAYFSENEIDQSRINWLYKQKYITKIDLEVIAGSKWLEEQIQLSSLFKSKPIHKILLSVDTQQFKPFDKIESRNIFGLPLSKKIVFFGAKLLIYKRKGFEYLLKALEVLKRELSEGEAEDIHLMVAGKTDLGIKFPFDFTSLGYLTHNELARAFSAADVFVNPSIEDSGPMMINQSILCGTPVVSFNMGVASDLVINGKTGYNVPVQDFIEMSRGIKSILTMDHDEFNLIRNNCRSVGLELCDPDKNIQKLLDYCTA